MKRYLPWLVGAALATAGVVPSLGNASGFGLPGDLDATFSGDGLQLTDLGGSDIAADVATQADGKLVVGGSSAGNFALARYTASGAPDPSFSGDGLVTTDFGGADAGQGVAVQADGRIVVAGRSGTDFAVARYTEAGVLDASFSGDGVQTTDFGADDAGAAVAIQADGRIVVAGQSGNNVALASYTAAGVLDPSFSADGRLTTDFGGFDGGRDVAIGADGKIVVAGASDTSDDGTPTGDFALARYLADGALDTSFSRDGRQTTDFGGTYDSGEGVAVLADGRIVVAGHGSAVDSIGSYFPSDFELARYDARGTLDPSFSGDGRQTTDFGGDEFGYGVALQPNGRIVAFGKAASAFALARYNADGSLDTGFAGDGRQTTEVTLLASNVVGVDGVPQADGKLVAVGASAGLGGITDFSLARYEGDTPDPNAPETLLTEGPSGPTNVTTPSFTFTAAAGSTFECKLDTPAGGGSYAACTSPQPYTTSENGAYAFSVRATRSGSTDESPATRTFTVDTVAPVARLLTGPPPAGEGLLRFTFDSNEPDTTFECRLDEVELPTSSYPCASPHTIGPVPNGSEYYFLLFPTDAAGNQGSTEIWPIFSVGGIPDTTLTGGPILGTVSDLTTQIAGAFSFTSVKAGSTFECKLDGPDTVTGDYAPCVSPTPYGPLVDGGYTFWVRSTDPGGIVASPAVRSFTVDTIAPQTSITAGPSGNTSVTSAVFSYASTQPHSYFTCRLDGPGGPGSSFPCISGETAFTTTANGTYTFSVLAMDGAGNVDASPATRTFTVGATPEPTPSATPTASPTASPTATATPAPTPISVPGAPTGSVPATLSVSLSSAPGLGPFVPAVAKDYETSLVATVSSSAGVAVLSVADPSATSTGRLSNGSFTLTRPIQARAGNAAFAPVTGSQNPVTLRAYTAPVTADQVTIGLRQAILATEALRTGTYSTALTFTLSTATP